MISSPCCALNFPGTPDSLWRLSLPDGSATLSFSPPVIEIEGASVTLSGPLLPTGTPITLPHGPVEHTLSAAIDAHPGLTLNAVFRVAEQSPIVRFRYELHSDVPRRLTKTAGQDALSYLSVSLADCPRITEVQLSQFNEMVHSFCLSERAVSDGEFADALSVMGPILTAEDATHCRLLAYEHGSQVPDAFLRFALSPERGATLQSVKGNYCEGQMLDAKHPFSTVWMQAALVPGDQDAMAAAYREFTLRFLSPNAESRVPYVFYNTWNFQERNKHWYGNAYLDSMTQDRIMAEIDTAHGLGIDVFVLDTGWYEKTGDWKVNTRRFPDSLASVKAKLDGYGMKLGLWFDPTVAAVSSRMLLEHQDCLMTQGGVAREPHPIWETEESRHLCLVSRYADAFAEELIRLAREVGVTYFKWDAIGQYGCDDPGHFHGTAANTVQERVESYAFQIGGAMARVVDKLCAACPEAIVDFDITEGARTVGLQFLAAGKYFLINNGPYTFNYNLPTPADGNVNLFFFAGPARSWICRTPLTYDKWLPSVLFLTHYFPDDACLPQGGGQPRQARNDVNQWLSLASLVLGQNGIWGDLLAVSETGVARFGETLAVYKTLRDDITSAALVRTGMIGGSPEVYEKISKAGRGVVSVFATAAGRYTYVTRAKVASGVWHNEGVDVRIDASGRAVITATFVEPGAKIVFTGTNSEAHPSPPEAEGGQSAKSSSCPFPLREGVGGRLSGRITLHESGI